MNRYKPTGWRNDNYRHSLAARGYRVSLMPIMVAGRERKFLGNSKPIDGFTEEGVRRAIERGYVAGYNEASTDVGVVPKARYLNDKELKTEKKKEKEEIKKLAILEDDEDKSYGDYDEYLANKKLEQEKEMTEALESDKKMFGTGKDDLIVGLRVQGASEQDMSRPNESMISNNTGEYKIMKKSGKTFAVANQNGTKMYRMMPKK
jgi:hypothetical protein